MSKKGNVKMSVPRKFFDDVCAVQLRRMRYMKEELAAKGFTSSLNALTNSSYRASAAWKDEEPHWTWECADWSYHAKQCEAVGPELNFLAGMFRSMYEIGFNLCFNDSNDGIKVQVFRSGEVLGEAEEKED